MDRKAFPRITALFALALSVATLVAGQSSTAKKLSDALNEVDKKLRAQEWKPAEKQARKVAQQIADVTGHGQGAAYTLAAASALRAFAEAGLGQHKDAAWHWDMALNLFPDIAKLDVSPYGPGALELRKRVLRPVENEMNPELIRLAQENGEAVVNPKERNVQKPKALKTPGPDYPQGLRILGTQGWVAVSSIIGADGRPREPRIVKSEGAGPAMHYVTLDALRQWRFEPAKLDGEPVDVYYVLTVNFKFDGR